MIKYIAIFITFAIIGRFIPNWEDFKNPYLAKNQLGQVMKPKLPLTMYLDSSIPKNRLNRFYSAAQSINADLRIEAIILKKAEKKTDANYRSFDGINTIYWVDETNFLYKENENEQAQALLFWMGKEIFEIDIRFNPKRHDFSQLNIESLIRHEFAHALGFDHYGDDLMNPYMPEHTKRGPLLKEQVQAFHKAHKIDIAVLTSKKKIASILNNDSK